jgi:hypothetical protein
MRFQKMKEMKDNEKKDVTESDIFSNVLVLVTHILCVSRSGALSFLVLKFDFFPHYYY